MLRFAGQALKGVGGFLKSNAGQNANEIALRLLPDIGFGALAAVQTPGDIGDKAIAGLTQATGGILGGIGTAGALRKAGANQNIQTLGDLAGSFAGDFAGMAVGDNLMRGKDKLMGGYGETPWERMSAEQQAKFAKDLEQQILFQYGLVPGTREQFGVDPSSGMGVA